jgi:hypothetical protein
MRDALRTQAVIGLAALLCIGIVAVVVYVMPRMHMLLPADNAFENGVHVTLSESAPRMNNAPAMLRSMSEPAIAVVQAGDGQAFAPLMAEILSPADKTAAEAMIKGKLAGLFGQNLSAQYDLLPMFAGPSTLYVTAIDEGTAMAIESQAENANEIVRSLHEAFGSTQAAVARDRRTFDDKYTSDVMRANTDAVNTVEKSDGMWVLRTTQNDGADAALFSAQSGNRFIIATTEELLTAVLRAPMVQQSRALARGQMDPRALQTLFERYNLTLQLPFEALQSMSGSVLHWQVNKKGNAAVLSIR